MALQKNRAKSHRNQTTCCVPIRAVCHEIDLYGLVITQIPIA